MLSIIGNILCLVLGIFIGYFMYRYSEDAYNFYMKSYGDQAKPYFRWSEKYSRLFKAGGIAFIIICSLLLLTLIGETFFS